MLLGPIVASALAAGLWWACRATSTFARARVFFAWIMGAGIATVAGSLIARVVVWATHELQRVIPSSWSWAGPLAQLIPWIAVAALAAAGYLTLHSIRNRPHPRAEILAMSFASLAVVTGALIGANFGHSLINNYKHATNNVVHTKGA